MGHLWARRALGAAILASLLGVGAVATDMGSSHAAAKPNFSAGRWRVVSLQDTTLTVTNTAGTTLVVTIAPNASLLHRFYGPFPLSDLSQVQTRDVVQLGYHLTGPGTATAYLLQDYSLQVAHTEVKGLVTRVAADHSSFVLQLTAVYGGQDAAFAVGENIRVETPNPTSVPVSYLQGGPTCGNASCLTTGLTLELYGLSDRPHHLVEQPQNISQVPANAPQIVHATSD